MTTYKELADRLDRSTRHDAYMHKLIEEAVAVLRSLDAQPVAEVSVMGSYHGKPILGCVLSNDSMQVGDKLFAAPVAAQPQQAKPEPLSDADYYEIGQRYSIPTVKIQAIHRELEAKRGIKEQG